MKEKRKKRKKKEDFLNDIIRSNWAYFQCLFDGRLRVLMGHWLIVAHFSNHPKAKTSIKLYQIYDSKIIIVRPERRLRLPGSVFPLRMARERIRCKAAACILKYFNIWPWVLWFARKIAHGYILLFNFLSLQNVHFTGNARVQYELCAGRWGQLKASLDPHRQCLLRPLRPETDDGQLTNGGMQNFAP